MYFRVFILSHSLADDFGINYLKFSLSLRKNSKEAFVSDYVETLSIMVEDEKVMKLKEEIYPKVKKPDSRH